MAVGIAIGANDFVTWRDELDSVEGLGAFRTLGRNLIASDGPSELYLRQRHDEIDGRPAALT